MTNRDSIETLTLEYTIELHCHQSSVQPRAATDLADPDLLTTRIQISRSGSVYKICLIILEHVQNKNFEQVKTISVAFLDKYPVKELSGNARKKKMLCLIE